LNILKKKLEMGTIFTKEMLINAGVTLAVVMVGLYVHDKFVAPMVKASNTPKAVADAPLSVNVGV
jgi:hypothetical protein